MAHLSPAVIDSLQHSPAVHDLVNTYFTQSFWELFLLGTAGALLHTLLTVGQFWKKKQSSPWPRLLLDLTISVLIVAIIVYVREDIMTILPLNKFIAAGVGYSAQSLFPKLVSLGLKRTSNEEASPPDSGT